MKCPACPNSLSPLSSGGITLDVCKNGCAGIWFDKNELAKFDEADEAIADEVLRALPNSNVVIDYSRQRYCPKCSGAPLSKRFSDSQRRIEVDECDSCSGVWLDIGELKVLRDQNKLSADRQKTMDEYLATQFQDGKPSKGVTAVFKLLFK